MNLYTTCVENKEKIMKTVYPSVIHSAVSSPKNSTGGVSGGNLYVSPDDSNSNTRNSKADEAKPNALRSSAKQGTSNLFKMIPNQILSPKTKTKTKRGMPVNSPKANNKQQSMGKRSFSNVSNNRLLNRNRYQRHSRLNNYLNFNS